MSGVLDQFFAHHFRTHPVNATFTGIHEHDTRLPDWSRAALATLDDAKAKQVAQGVFDVDQRTLDLRKKYFEEMSGAVSPKTAARFIQIERRIQQLVDVQIASRYPEIKK